MRGIMFVCTGNICRSAMAHHYCQKRVYDLKRENEIVVSSCGTSALNGDKSTQAAIKKRFGKQVSSSIVNAAFNFGMARDIWSLGVLLYEIGRRVI